MWEVLKCSGATASLVWPRFVPVNSMSLAIIFSSKASKSQRSFFQPLSQYLMKPTPWPAKPKNAVMIAYGNKPSKGTGMFSCGGSVGSGNEESS